MKIAARVNWCVHVVVHDEVARLGTVQADTYRDAYQEAARQFGVSREHQNQLFVRPIDRGVPVPRRRTAQQMRLSATSASGTKRTSLSGPGMSAFGGKADVRKCAGDVR